MSNNSSLLAMEGQIVSRSFSPGLVVLSYVVSWIGAWTTLELFNKRTAGRGLYNCYLLVGSSISMGGIAIWGMHFLGNRAIILGNDDSALQVAYNPAFTAASFFLPIVVLLAAFITIGSNETFSWLRVGLGGAMVGLSICGMHYLGQAGISNYSVEYMIANIVGSVMIAVVATITALFVFFILRATWTASWWHRALTASLLAGAVSGMHWVAETGTQYRLRQGDISPDRTLSRNSTVIVVIILSVAACFILLIFSLLAQRRRARSANRAQQVVLATAIFDKDGKLMVTPEGLLPSQKITNSFIEKSFDDIFGISHPVFHWIFRTTRNWSAVEALIPAMRNHINHISITRGTRAGAADLALANEYGEPIDDYSIIFRELFCIAASDLADQLNQPLEGTGVLFDEILSTGQTSQHNKSKARKSMIQSSPLDTERGDSGPQVFGRGQLLFLTRRASRREAENFQNAGYRFAGIRNVVDILARSMEINSDELNAHLTDMSDYSSKTNILEPGVHMACFAIRANVRGSFDILVRRDARNQLPTMQMPLLSLDSWQQDYLSQLDGMSVSACIKFLESKLSTPHLPKQEQTFAAQLQDTLETLRDEFKDPLFLEAALIATPVSAPCRGVEDNAPPGQATLIAFRLIIPIHSRSPGDRLEFVPLSFFKMQQHVYKNSPDHSVFARRVHREFGPILNQSRPSMSDRDIGPFSPNSFQINGSSKSLMELRDELEYKLPTLIPRAPPPRKSIIFWKKNLDVPEPNSSRLSVRTRDDASSENNLVDQNPFGGILVSQEVTVDVREAGRVVPLKVSDMEMMEMMTTGMEGTEKMKLGTLGIASTEMEDPETYVDSLFAVCIETR